MTVYAIAQGRIADRKAMNAYVAAAGPTLDRYGVKCLALDEAPEIVEGEVPFPRTVILEFESTDAFRRWYDSDEYRAARKIRECAAVGTFILVQGF